MRGHERSWYTLRLVAASRTRWLVYGSVAKDVIVGEDSAVVTNLDSQSTNGLSLCLE